MTDKSVSDRLLGMATALYELIEIKLGRSLASWIAERRPPAPPVTSWRDLAAEIERETGTVVSWETLRAWFPDDAEVAS